MIETVESASPEVLAKFADIIDVRSPAEFAEDHVPGAVNLPVLSDDERAAVGTIYVHDSPHRARKIGAAMVARNIAGHLETALADTAPRFSPLIYCWRGGQRSSALASVLSQIGWRVHVLKGGYRTYRRRVMTTLYGASVSLPIILLDGETGTAKTDILRRLTALGVQTIDLESLAGHRGSLFGAIPGTGQPSQKLFESGLLAAVERLDPAAPILVEAESSKVGERVVPPAIWSLMSTAPVIRLEAAVPDRARYLVCEYADILEDMASLEAIIERLPRHHSREQRKVWRELARERAFETLAAQLVTAHYDPAYRRSASLRPRRELARVGLGDLSEASRERGAGAVAGIISRGDIWQ